MKRKKVSGKESLVENSLMNYQRTTINQYDQQRVQPHLRWSEMHLVVTN
jgi:hypothetical protein